MGRLGEKIGIVARDLAHAFGRVYAEYGDVRRATTGGQRDYTALFYLEPVSRPEFEKLRAAIMLRARSQEVGDLPAATRRNTAGLSFSLKATSADAAASIALGEIRGAFADAGLAAVGAVLMEIRETRMEMRQARAWLYEDGRS